MCSSLIFKFSGKQILFGQYKAWATFELLCRAITAFFESFKLDELHQKPSLGLDSLFLSR